MPQTAVLGSTNRHILLKTSKFQRNSVDFVASRLQECGFGTTMLVMAKMSRASTPEPEAALDDISKAIIEQLQVDGRGSYANIAKAVGLSEAAVRQRVQRLLSTGLMQIVAVTDPLQLGFRRQAMMGVSAEGDLSKVAAKLSSIPEASYVVTTAGRFDILIEVVCEDDHHLLEVINKIRSMPGVTNTESFLYLKLNKQHYNWGTR